MTPLQILLFINLGIMFILLFIYLFLRLAAKGQEQSREETFKRWSEQ